MNLSRMSGARTALWGLLVAVVVSFGLLAFGQSAYAQTSPVANKIIVNGASRGDVSEIKSYFNGTDQASVNRAVTDLSATGMFSKVSARIVGDTVVVNVVEGSQILNRVAFEGNSKLKGDQLAVEVQSKGYSAFNKAVADADVQRIKDAYKKIGRNDVTVTYRLVQLPNGRDDLVFKVDEGDKTGVKKIVFIGNHNISSWRLKSLMQIDGDELPVVVQDQRRLQSRHARLGRGGDSQILYALRLRRFPHHQYRRGLRTLGKGLRHHDQPGRGAAVSRIQRQRDVAAAACVGRPA